jgi:hypothetical protein
MSEPSGAATDNIRFVQNKVLAQTAVYWPPQDGETDMYGRPVVSPPCEIAVRWDEKIQEIIGGDGTRVMSKAEIMADRDLEIGGVLMLGTLADVLDVLTPKDNPGACEIMSIAKTPDFKGRRFLRQAFL